MLRIFFDPQEPEAVGDKNAISFRPVLRHFISRLMFYAMFCGVFLFLCAVTGTVRLFALLDPNGAKPLFIVIPAAVATGVALLIWMLLRGMPFLLVYALLLGGFDWLEYRDMIAPPGAYLGDDWGRGFPYHREIFRAWWMVAAGGLGCHLLVYFFGKTVGYRPPVRWGTLLGQRVRPRLGNNDVMAYVVYPELGIFEEVLFKKFKDYKRSIPIRPPLLKSSTKSGAKKSPAMGVIDQPGWSSLMEEMVKVFAVAGRLDWRCVNGTEPLLSLIGPQWDKFRCEPGDGAGGWLAETDLAEQSAARKGHRKPDWLPLISGSYRAPQPGFPCRVTVVPCVEASRSISGFHVAQIEWDGFHLKPLAAMPLLVEKEKKLMTALEECGRIHLEVGGLQNGVPSEDLWPALKSLLAQIKSKSKLQISQVSPQLDVAEKELKTWDAAIGSAEWEFAHHYLTWLADANAKLPPGLEIDPFTGILSQSAPAAPPLRIEDLGHTLVVHGGPSAKVFALAVNQKLPLNDFLRQLNIARQFHDSLDPGANKSGAR